MKQQLLNRVEQDSSAWQKVLAHQEARLAALRKQIENPATPSAERDGLAWRIDEIKRLFRAVNPPEEKETAAD